MEILWFTPILVFGVIGIVEGAVLVRRMVGR